MHPLRAGERVSGDEGENVCVLGLRGIGMGKTECENEGVVVPLVDACEFAEG